LQFKVDIKRLIADNHSPLSYTFALFPLIAPDEAHYRHEDLFLTSLTDFEVWISIHLM
jgi:hypothetical protein